MCRGEGKEAEGEEGKRGMHGLGTCQVIERYSKVRSVRKGLKKKEEPPGSKYNEMNG